MLGLQHKIVLEDHEGERHTLHLLEIVADQFFVLLPPSQAVRLDDARNSDAAVADHALDILTQSLSVISVRDHRFLHSVEVPEVLAQSRHHILRLCGLRLEPGLPACQLPDTSDLAAAFAQELTRRQHW